MAVTKRPGKLLRNLNAKVAAVPMVLTTLVVFLGGTLWTVLYSLWALTNMNGFGAPAVG